MDLGEKLHNKIIDTDKDIKEIEMTEQMFLEFAQDLKNGYVGYFEGIPIKINNNIEDFEFKF